MKITIDTKAKTISIEEQCTIKEFNDLLELFKISDGWILLPMTKIQIQTIKELNPIFPKPSQPYYEDPNPYQISPYKLPNITCDATI